MEIASGIVSHLSGIGGDVFTVQIVPPGWIHLELTDSMFSGLVAKSCSWECGQKLGNREFQGEK